MSSGPPATPSKVSYAIASYNHARYIARTLDSIYAEAYPAFEIIVVDDGSSDNSAEVIREWIARHPDVSVQFTQRPNKGVAATLNELIALAQGEFIRPCSSDDELIAGSTEKMVAAMLEHRQLAAVFTDGTVIDPDGKTIHESIIRFNGGNMRNYTKDVEAAIISDWAVAGPLILWRSAPMKAEKAYEESLTVEDWYLYSKLAARRAIGFLPISSVRYRIHTTNTCITKDVSARIRNTDSQLAGAARNVTRLSGGLRLLMLSEISLLKAKLHYLKRQFVRGIPQLLNHYVQRGLGRLIRCFEQKTGGVGPSDGRSSAPPPLPSA